MGVIQNSLKRIDWLDLAGTILCLAAGCAVGWYGRKAAVNYGWITAEPTEPTGHHIATGPDALKCPFIASVNGEVYHLPGCGHVRRIKPASLRGYATAADAEADGLRRCSECADEVAQRAAAGILRNTEKPMPHGM